LENCTPHLIKHLYKDDSGYSKETPKIGGWNRLSRLRIVKEKELSLRKRSWGKAPSRKRPIKISLKRGGRKGGVIGFLLGG